MKYHISELLDAEKVQGLLKTFRKITQMTCTLTDPEGVVLKVNGNNLLSSGWQRVCSDFHKDHPGTFARCIESDTYLSRQIQEKRKYALYECHNGLIDCAIPIYIEGEHVVNLFTGQFFFSPPDIEFFRKQAMDFGFDEKDYLSAIDEVPVLDRKKVEDAIDFLTELAELIAHMGYKEKELLGLKDHLEEKVEERTKELKEASAEIQTLQGIIPICMHCKGIRDDEGYWGKLENYFESKSGAQFSHSICDKCLDELYPAEDDDE